METYKFDKFGMRECVSQKCLRLTTERTPLGSPVLKACGWTWAASAST